MILKWLYKAFESQEQKVKKLIEKSKLFDIYYYMNNYCKTKECYNDPLGYYLAYGIKQEHKPNESFDPQWYIEFYTDVRDSGMYPFVHFVQFGMFENRFINQNEYDLYHELLKKGFDAKRYKEYYPDLDKLKDDFNSILHYVRYGQKEGRKAFFLENDKLNFHELSSMFISDKYQPNLIVDKPIDILIPVYNGIEFLEPLLDSIYNNTTLPYRLLICDDKSTDKLIYPLLDRLIKKFDKEQVILLQNEVNLGFVKTVNRLVQYTNNHFVLLNTDTEVPSFWLERLMYPIIMMDNVATTTPFTNAGTICSFPNYLEDNSIFENLSVEEVDRYFKLVSSSTYIKIPTGVGFCMGVNKDLIDKIGMFDTVFGKGYGEENDLSQRAIKEGYTNIHVTNLFVYHKHGGSFASDEKKRLIQNNLQILNQRYPTYNQQVAQTIQEDKLSLLRDILYFQIKSDIYQTILILDHNLGGGTRYYIDRYVKEQLQSDKLVFVLRYDISSTTYSLRLYSQDKELEFVVSDFSLIDMIFTLFHIEVLFINSLVSYPDIDEVISKIVKLYHQYSFKVVVPVHDYFLVCPNYTLVNHKIRYCELPDNNISCQNCLVSNRGDFKAFEYTNDIVYWRECWDKVLKITDKIIVFSNSSKDIVAKVYPKYSNKIDINPHNIDGKYQHIYTKSDTKQRVIGVLGGINIPKGALVIKDLVKYIDKHKLNVKVVLIGDISEHIQSPCFFKTGRYKAEELSDLVLKYQITEFFIPSIWPETFSYVTDEIIQMGYPLTVFNLGAPSERVQSYPLGKVIEIDELYTIL
jgi:GT2 family glycosyltransferase